MKKTLALLIALGSCAVSSEAATAFTYHTNTTKNPNANYAIYGFYLALDSKVLEPVADTSSPKPLSGDIRLDSFILKGPEGAAGNGVTYGFLVLNGTDNSVIGLSTETGICGNNTNLKFNFKAVDGSSLILDASTTYRYLTVSKTVMDRVNGDTSKNYIYNAGGTQDATFVTSGDGATVTISKGLVAPGIRGHYAANGVPADSVVIGGVDGTSTGITIKGNTTTGTLSPVFMEIKGAVVPEPATATLSLLGLAALMTRRRRA